MLSGYRPNVVIYRDPSLAAINDRAAEIYVVDATAIASGDAQTWSFVDGAGSAGDAWSGLIANPPGGVVSWRTGNIESNDTSYYASAQSSAWQLAPVTSVDGEGTFAVLPLDASVEWGTANDSEDYVVEPETADPPTTGTIRDMLYFDDNSDPVGLDNFASWTQSFDAGDEFISEIKGSDDLPEQPIDPGLADPMVTGYVAHQSIKGYFFGSDYMTARAIVDFTPGLQWKVGVD